MKIQLHTGMDGCVHAVRLQVPTCKICGQPAIMQVWQPVSEECPQGRFTFCELHYGAITRGCKVTLSEKLPDQPITSISIENAQSRKGVNIGSRKIVVIDIETVGKCQNFMSRIS